MLMERIERIVLPMCSEKANKKIDSMISIVDMSRFEIGGILDKDFLNGNEEITKVFEQNYPRILKKLYMINVPTVFNIAWKTMSWMLSDKFKAKIQMLGEDWQKTIEKEVTSVKNLPKSLGGGNPTPILEYRNFWDEEYYKSFKEHRFTRK